MSTKKKMLAWRALASVGAAALGLMGVIGLSATAAAASAPEGTPPAAGLEGSLTIHKLAGTATDQENNGTELEEIDRAPLGGVTFTICKVAGRDLTTNAGWVGLADLVPADQTCDATWQYSPTSQTTGNEGVVTFPNLPIGLYKVTESVLPDSGITPGGPFLVTIPYPSVSSETVEGDDGPETTETSTWIWDVHVYPKNDLSGDGDKTVADPSSHVLGATVPWEITTRPLRSFNDGQPLTTYKIIDRPNTNLNYISTPAPTLKYTAPGEAPATVPAANYTITPTSADGTAHTAEVVVEVTNLEWLNALPAGTVFTFNLSTKVVGVGPLENTSFENTGGDEGDVETGIAYTYWGPLAIKKVDGSGNPLASAVFSVYEAAGDRPAAGTCPTTPTGTAVATGTSDATGVVKWAGYPVTSNATLGLWIQNSDTPVAAPQRNYCVYETTVPLGYTATAFGPAALITPDALATGTYTFTVANIPEEGPGLPRTGASGTMLLTVGGLGLVALAGGMYLINRRQPERK